MIVIPLHRAALIFAILDPFIGIGPRLTGFEEEIGSGDLAIVCRSGMAAVEMHRLPSGEGRKIIEESDARGLAGRPAHREAGVGSSIGPHIGAWPIQYRHACFEMLIGTSAAVLVGGKSKG